MPLYDYRCAKCGFSLEHLSWGLAEVVVCPECQEGMNRMPSKPAMIKIKGMGGYPSRRKELQDRQSLMSRKQIPYFSPKT